MPTPFDLIHNAIDPARTPVEQTHAIINSLIAGGYRFSPFISDVSREVPNPRVGTTFADRHQHPFIPGAHILAADDPHAGRGLFLDLMLIHQDALPLPPAQWSAIAPCLIPRGQAFIIRDLARADLRED